MLPVEQIIANQIMETVHRLQLPLKLDQLTEGRGNCFPIAVLQQCRRPEVKNLASKLVQIMARHPNGHRKLRSEVKKNTLSSENSNIVKFKREYDQSVALVSGETWEEYWDKMEEDQMWVDSIFVQATAWYLKLDIWIIDTSCTDSNPYIKVSGNIDDENIPIQGPILTIGSKSNSHFQSLLPIEDFFFGNTSRNDQGQMSEEEVKSPSKEVKTQQDLKTEVKSASNEVPTQLKFKN